jgi:hypothetical protein
MFLCRKINIFENRMKQERNCTIRRPKIKESRIYYFSEE